MSDKTRGLVVLILGAAAYFVAYPEDAQAITTPATTFLSLTTAVSPWLYGVVAAGILGTAMAKTWGGRRET